MQLAAGKKRLRPGSGTHTVLSHAHRQLVYTRLLLVTETVTQPAARSGYSARTLTYRTGSSESMIRKRNSISCGYLCKSDHIRRFKSRSYTAGAVWSLHEGLCPGTLTVLWHTSTAGEYRFFRLSKIRANQRDTSRRYISIYTYVFYLYMCIYIYVYTYM